MMYPFSIMHKQCIYYSHKNIECLTAISRSELTNISTINGKSKLYIRPMIMIMQVTDYLHLEMEKYLQSLTQVVFFFDLGFFLHKFEVHT